MGNSKSSLGFDTCQAPPVVPSLNLGCDALMDFKACPGEDAQQAMYITTSENIPMNPWNDGVLGNGQYTGDGEVQEGTSFRRPLLQSEAASIDLPFLDTREVPDAIITVVVDKIEPTQRLGLRSIPCKGSHSLCFIHPGGLLDQWNLKNASTAIEPGDHIVDVNGVRDDALSIKKEWTGTAKLCMKLIAVRILDPVIHKEAGAKLGIRTRAGKKVHQITSIDEGGLIDKWNQVACQMKGGKASQKVKVIQSGDYIVEVNDMQGDAELIRSEWISTDTVKLVVMSPRVRHESLPSVGDVSEAEERDG